MKKKPTKLISIDSSTSITGYAIFLSGVLFQSDVINYKKVSPIENRFPLMVKDVIALLQREKPDIVAIELTSVSINGNTQRLLTELLGIIHGYCILHDIFYYSYRVSQWRKIIGGEEKLPKDKKQWAIDKVHTLHPEIMIKTDDQAEAILIGEAYIKDFSKNIEK